MARHPFKIENNRTSSSEGDVKHNFEILKRGNETYLYSCIFFPDRSYAVISPPACLEPEINYKIRIEFYRYKVGVQTPDAAINVDSVS